MKEFVAELETYFNQQDTLILMKVLLNETQPLDPYLKDQFGIDDYSELNPDMLSGLVFGLSLDQLDKFVADHPELENRVNEVYHNSVRWKAAKERISRGKSP